jgi:hypothetical protein
VLATAFATVLSDMYSAYRCVERREEHHQSCCVSNICGKARLVLLHGDRHWYGDYLPENLSDKPDKDMIQELTQEPGADRYDDNMIYYKRERSREKVPILQLRLFSHTICQIPLMIFACESKECSCLPAERKQCAQTVSSRQRGRVTGHDQMPRPDRAASSSDQLLESPVISQKLVPRKLACLAN